MGNKSNRGSKQIYTYSYSPIANLDAHPSKYHLIAIHFIQFQLYVSQTLLDTHPCSALLLSKGRIPLYSTCICLRSNLKQINVRTGHDRSGVRSSRKIASAVAPVVLGIKPKQREHDGTHGLITVSNQDIKGRYRTYRIKYYIVSNNYSHVCTHRPSIRLTFSFDSLQSYVMFQIDQR